MSRIEIERFRVSSDDRSRFGDKNDDSEFPPCHSLKPGSQELLIPLLEGRVSSLP